MTSNLPKLVLFLTLATGLPLAAKDAKTILAETGVTGGLVVHLDCGDGRLTGDLRQSESILVRGLDTRAEQVTQARQHLRERGIYGPASVARYDGRTLPFIDDSVTLIVAENPSVPMSEMMRALHPHGVAYVDGKASTKPKPDTIDEWTHYLHGADNNAVAHDTRIGPPRHMQFLADPVWTRHHDRLASITTMVTAKGRMFSINDNGAIFSPEDEGQWTVTARNAFNGILLWTKPISSWTSIKRKFRSGPVQLQRLLVTDGERVFVTLGLGEPVSVLDAATGGELAVLEGTENAEEFVLEDDILYLQIGENGAEQLLTERKLLPGLDFKTNKLCMAVDTRANKTVWRWPAEGTAEIMPRTLTVSNGRVFVQEKGETMCLDAASGKALWRTALVSPDPAAKPSENETAKGAGRNKKKKKAKSAAARSLGWTYCTLVAQDGVVLSSDGQTLRALDAESGKLLWSCQAKTPFGKTPSVDILVVGGRVWTSPGFGQGRDLRTGEVTKSNPPRSELVTAGHHHRCYRNKATDRYVIEGHRGLEFHDTTGDQFIRHNWIRGVCQYGIMPANGFVYMPSHNCSCYPEAKLFGMWTLKSTESSIDLDTLTHSSHLEKGPAYGSLRTDSPDFDNEWPMHRHDAGRTGVVPSSVSATKTAWKIAIGGQVSAPVVAGGTLLVSSYSTHQVLAFDPESGAPQWSFTVGGAVDSAPTIHGDAVLFGCRDGHVYCLRRRDGVLAWRFRAAPLERQTVSRQQVESLWPVHGSILVADDTAWFTAGRSTYLDGGIFLYGLDPITGQVLQKGRLDSPPARANSDPGNHRAEGISQNKTDYKTFTAADRSDGFSMAEGNISDILLARDGALYLRHQKLSMKLKPAEEFTHHLFSTSRLLDDNESYRAHWFFGNGDFSRLPVAYEWLTRGSFGGFASPLGKFMVYDKQTVWGATWKNLALYKTDITGIDGKLEKDFPKSPSMRHQSLAESLPIHTRAMIKTGRELHLGGYPADAPATHVSNAPITDKGLVLRIDAVSGEILSQTEIPSCPRFDSISAAHGRLYLTLENGELMCLK